MELRLRLGVLASIVPLLVSCNREERFESVCQLIRSDIVDVDEKGAPETVDVELEWDPCPGDQFQAVRGGKEFAVCMQRYRLGQLLPVLVKHWWDSRGYYRWDVYKVGECSRDIEPDAEGSYEKSQDCRDAVTYGHVDGFSCSRHPLKQLLGTCPWMVR